MLNKTDGLRRDFNLDLISLKEDGTAKVSQLRDVVKVTTRNSMLCCLSLASIHSPEVVILFYFAMTGILNMLF